MKRRSFLALLGVVAGALGIPASKTAAAEPPRLQPMATGHLGRRGSRSFYALKDPEARANAMHDDEILRSLLPADARLESWARPHCEPHEDGPDHVDVTFEVRLKHDGRTYARRLTFCGDFMLDDQNGERAARIRSFARMFRSPLIDEAFRRARRPRRSGWFS